MADKRRDVNSEDDIQSFSSGTPLVAKSSSSVSLHFNLGQCSALSTSLCPANHNDLSFTGCRQTSSLQLIGGFTSQQASNSETPQEEVAPPTEYIHQLYGPEDKRDSGCKPPALSNSSDSRISTQSVSSTDSDICRICQLTVKESAEPLQESGCSCKGSLRMCHRTCLHQWVKQRMRTQCELCQKSFALRLVPIGPPRRTNNGDVNRERQGDGRGPEDEDDTEGCRDHRRLWFAIIFCVLSLSLASAAGLTAHTRREYLEAVAEDRHHKGQEAMNSHNYILLNDHHIKTQFINTKVHNAEFMYGLSAAILVCSIALTLAVGTLWMFAEFWVWPQDLRLRRVRERVRRLRNLRQTTDRPEDYQIEDWMPDHETPGEIFQMRETSV